MNRSKLEQKFLELISENPEQVLSTLTDWQLSKSLIINDKDKLSSMGLQRKYGFDRRNISRFLKKETQKNDTNNSK